MVGLDLIRMCIVLGLYKLVLVMSALLTRVRGSLLVLSVVVTLFRVYWADFILISDPAIIMMPRLVCEVSTVAASFVTLEFMIIILVLTN